MDGDLAAHVIPEKPRASQPSARAYLNDAYRTRRRVTPEMQAAGADALATTYLGVAIDVGGAHPKVLTSDSAMGIAAARAYLAMEQVNEQGERDNLQHPGLFGSDDLMIWQAMSPSHRAEFIQQQSSDYLLGAVGMIRGFRCGIENPSQKLALGMLCDSLTALARELHRAATIQRRAVTDRKEQAALRDEAIAAQAEEDRQRNNRARAERRRRAKERSNGPAMRAEVTA